ncbi:MAG: ankyrin repeat domain-containing protein [bacterium]
MTTTTIRYLICMTLTMMLCGCGQSSSTNPETIRLLLACGLEVNATDNLGATPLHYAVFRDYRETAAELLHGGADPNRRLSREAVVETFSGQIRPQETSVAEFTALMLAKSGEMKDLLRRYGARE